MSHIRTIRDEAYRDLRVEEIEIELSHAFNTKRLFLNHSLHKQDGTDRPLLKIDVINLDNIEKEAKLSIQALAGTRLAFFFAAEADIKVGSAVFYPEELLPPSINRARTPLIPMSRRLPPPSAHNQPK